MTSVAVTGHWHASSAILGDSIWVFINSQSMFNNIPRTTLYSRYANSAIKQWPLLVDDRGELLCQLLQQLLVL